MAGAGRVHHLVLAAEAVDRLGDTLVFLPGEREIRDATDLLEGRNYRDTLVLPLFARQAGAEQSAVFHPVRSKRRIILATNVAETSLTIPGIRFVIDSGLARVSRHDPGSGIQRLQIEPVSQASARQRRGRCGRISEGVCVRLYSEEDFESRPPFTDPEILRWWQGLFEIPCVAIGGITPGNCGPLIEAGADFLAVSQAVWGADEQGAVRDFVHAIERAAD